MITHQEELAEKIRALSHPARLEIIQLLKDKKRICGELVGLLPFAQATVSQHLKVLKDAGFVIGENDGTKVCYTLNEEELNSFKKIIAEL